MTAHERNLAQLPVQGNTTSRTLTVPSPSAGQTMAACSEGTAAAAGPPTGDSFEGALLQALRRRWLLAFVLGLLAAGLAAGATWFLLPPQYTTTALLHIKSQPTQGLFTTPENLETHEDFLAFQRTQAALLKSREVIQAALRLPEVADRAEVREQANAVQWLTESLKVDSTLGPEVLRVSLTGSHPEDLPILVNAVTAAYLHELTAKERLKQPARLEQLQSNYRRLEESLRRKRALLRELETSLGVEPQEMIMLRYQSAILQRTTTEKEYLKAKVELKIVEKELALLKEPIPKDQAPRANLELEQLLAQDITYQALRTSKLKLEETISRIKTIYSPEMQGNVLQEPLQQLAVIDREIEARRESLRPALVAQKLAKLEVQAAILTEQESEMAATLKQQSADIAQLAAKIRNPDKPTSDLQALRDEVAQIERVLMKVGEQREFIHVEPLRPLRVSLLEAAAVPLEMDGKRQAKMAILAGSCLFGLVVLGVCWQEYRSQRIDNEDEVARSLGLDLLGTLPTVSTAALLSRRGTQGKFYGQEHLNVWVDAIRDRLYREPPEESPPLLLITSAVADEGKTVLASWLAARCAAAQRKTLLIDGDLLQPRVHRLFGLPAGPGFSEVLQGKLQLTAGVRRTSVPGLDVFPAGKWDSQAVAALSQEMGSRLLDHLKNHYDAIIVVSSPVLAETDAQLFARYADAVLLSVQRHVSQLASIQDTAQRLAKLDAPVRGAVVSGIGTRIYHPGFAAPAVAAN